MLLDCYLPSERYGHECVVTELGALWIPDIPVTIGKEYLDDKRAVQPHQHIIMYSTPRGGLIANWVFRFIAKLSFTWHCFIAQTKTKKTAIRKAFILLILDIPQLRFLGPYRINGTQFSL